MDLVIGYSKSKITCKRASFIKKVKSDQAVCLIIFVISVFYFDQSSAQLLMFMVKATKPFCAERIFVWYFLEWTDCKTYRENVVN